MKKRVLVSYIVALEVIFANISFALYAVPVHEFFPIQENAMVSSEAPVIAPVSKVSLEAMVPQQRKSTVKAVPAVQEVIHDDEITLFQVIGGEKETNNDDSMRTPYDDDFTQALERELDQL